MKKTSDRSFSLIDSPKAIVLASVGDSKKAFRKLKFKKAKKHYLK